MTIGQIYENALIEINKLKAPALLLEDFNYLLNKAIQQYINQVYNRCEYNQQSSDDLKVLQTTIILEDSKLDNSFNNNIWTFSLPANYLHLLNCLAEFENNSEKTKCGGAYNSITSNCNRLTSDLQGGITNNYYMKPSHKKPYYYIINSTLDNNIIQVHSGDSIWNLNKILLTYIRIPKYIEITQEQLLTGVGLNEPLEFPDYVCYEIINVFSKLLLENASDPRLQTNIPINATIANGQ